MAVRTVNILGLCSGLGWLEFSAAEALRARGIGARVMCHCEREAVTAWQRVIELDPAAVPAIEPGFSVVADGLAVAGADLLRIGGNGVVPLAAALAFDVLLDEAFGTRI